MGESEPDPVAPPMRDLPVRVFVMGVFCCVELLGWNLVVLLDWIGQCTYAFDCYSYLIARIVA